MQLFQEVCAGALATLNSEIYDSYRGYLMNQRCPFEKWRESILHPL